jgi:hypothetical protein
MLQGKEALGREECFNNCPYQGSGFMRSIVSLLCSQAFARTLSKNKHLNCMRTEQLTFGLGEAIQFAGR